MNQTLNNRIGLVVLMTVIVSMLALLGQPVSAQEISNVQNRIYGGDSLEQRRMDFKAFEIQGKGQTWSLEGVKALEKKYRSKYSERKDTVIGSELCSRMVYEQTEKGQQIVGMQDNLSRISYDMPETWLRFPMKQGDSISGYFSGSGLYCDRMFMRRFGTYMTKADSVGKLILPDGKALYGVIRVHTERRVGAVYGDKDTLRKALPRFTADSIVRHMATDTLKVREDVYRWYAGGYRYPILEARVTTLRDKPIEQLLFYCIPEEQELLASNDVNKAVREAIARAGESSQSEEQAASRHGRAFEYGITQNENGVTIRYQAEGNPRIVALLANSQGYVYQRKEAGGTSGSGSIDLSTSGLRRGQYVVYLNVDGKAYAEKLNVK